MISNHENWQLLKTTGYDKGVWWGWRGHLTQWVILRILWNKKILKIDIIYSELNSMNHEYYKVDKQYCIKFKLLENSGTWLDKYQ